GAGQLAVEEGQYVVRGRERGKEGRYLDGLLLAVVDHPADVRVYPDERFAVSETPPSQDLLVLGAGIFPERARDHRGRDVTATLRHWDRDTVDAFARRTWLGLAEEHPVELDFGRGIPPLRPPDR